MTHIIRVGLLPHFSSTIIQFGKDPEQVFKAVGINPSEVDIADTFIPYPQFRQLLVEAVKATGSERFGLLMSERLGPQSLGVVGFAMQQSTDVGAAFEILARFLHLHDQHGTVTLEPQKELIRIAYCIDDLHLPGATQAIDVAAALAHNILKGPHHALRAADNSSSRFQQEFPPYTLNKSPNNLAVPGGPRD